MDTTGADLLNHQRQKASHLEVPVILIVYNRPTLTAELLQTIRMANPRNLLVIGDGPKDHEDKHRCREVRRLIDDIRWTTDLDTNFSETNLGCNRRVSTGLDWAFEIVDRAIILEDDCIPHFSFFEFCNQLLQRYETDQRVMTISGSNFQFGSSRSDHSYYFSRYPHSWGWATWKRAWSLYDAEMTLWPEVRNGGWLKDILGNADAADWWSRIFERTYRGEIDSWAYRWTYSSFIQNALSIVPRVNLVSNIGFSSNATHTKKTTPFADLPANAIEFPLTHPKFVIRDSRADRYTQETLFGTHQLLSRLRRKLLYLTGRRIW